MSNDDILALLSKITDCTYYELLGTDMRKEIEDTIKKLRKEEGYDY